MKLRPIAAWILAIPMLTPVLSLAQTVPAPPPANAAPSDDKKTELEERMTKMNKAFRKLRKQVADPAQTASSLDLVATMQEAAKESLDLTPEKAADIPDDQKAKFMADYKAGIRAMQDELAKLSDALTAGKNADAAKIVADMFDLEKKSHKEFRRPPKD
ncbi:MAG TPA: cytochrome b562 [Opitutaceae bacterium]